MDIGCIAKNVMVVGPQYSSSTWAAFGARISDSFDTVLPATAFIVEQLGGGYYWIFASGRATVS